MQVSPAGLSLVQAWEGIVDGDPSTVLLDPYIDPKGFYTVGWGHLLTTPNGVPISINTFGAAQAKALAEQAMMNKFGAKAITRDQAVALLHEDMAKAEAFVNAHISPNSTSQGEFDALCAFCFNCGAGNFLNSSVLRLHNGGNHGVGTIGLPDLAAWSKGGQHSHPTTMPQAFAAWSYSAGSWMLGLFRRRVSEALVYGGLDGTTAYKDMMAFHG